jgi:hypothetical protein
MKASNSSAFTGNSMQQPINFMEELSKLNSDDEIVSTLQDEFSKIGAIEDIYRYSRLTQGGAREFLVHFKDSGAAIQTANQYKLYTFGFNGVWVRVR